MASVSDQRDSPAQVQPPALGSGDLSHRPDQLLPELQEGGQESFSMFLISLLYNELIFGFCFVVHVNTLIWSHSLRIEGIIHTYAHRRTSCENF